MRYLIHGYSRNPEALDACIVDATPALRRDAGAGRSGRLRADSNAVEHVQALKPVALGAAPRQVAWPVNRPGRFQLGGEERGEMDARRLTPRTGTGWPPPAGTDDVTTWCRSATARRSTRTRISSTARRRARAEGVVEPRLFGHSHPVTFEPLRRGVRQRRSIPAAESRPIFPTGRSIW